MTGTDDKKVPPKKKDAKNNGKNKLQFPKRTERMTRMKPGELSDDHAGLLEARLAVLEAALRVPRVASRKKTSVAELDPDTRRVRVSANKGAVIQTMGDWDAGTQYLWPEEALFLLDKGSLELSVGGETASFQRGMAVLLPWSGLTMADYVAYAHFRRAGYVPRRLSEEDARKSVPPRVMPRFAVWAPNTFRRKQGGPPEFHLVVQQVDSSLPSQEECEVLVRNYCSVKFCTVDKGTISISNIFMIGSRPEQSVPVLESDPEEGEDTAEDSD